MILRLRHNIGLIIGAANLLGIASGVLVLFSPRSQLGLALLAVGCCALGFIRPPLAWACALSAGAGLAFVCLIVPVAGIVAPFTVQQGTLILAIGLAVAFAGAYLGALAGRIVAPPKKQNDV